MSIQDDNGHRLTKYQSETPSAEVQSSARYQRRARLIRDSVSHLAALTNSPTLSYLLSYRHLDEQSLQNLKDELFGQDFAKATSKAKKAAVRYRSNSLTSRREYDRTQP